MDSHDTLARTLYGEARGCGAAGMRHVASVILNRVSHPRWWGRGVIGVCQAPRQFSCWNADDPNHAKLLAVTEADAWFAIACAIANTALMGKLQDETGNADSYYALTMKHPPGWTARATHTYSDGWHSFWRVELAAPSGEPDAPVVSVHAPVPIYRDGPRADDSADNLMAREQAGESFPLTGD